MPSISLSAVVVDCGSQLHFPHPLTQPGLQIRQRGIKGWIVIGTFPDEIIINQCPNERGDGEVVVVADFDRAGGF